MALYSLRALEVLLGPPGPSSGALGISEALLCRLKGRLSLLEALLGHLQTPRGLLKALLGPLQSRAFWKVSWSI